MRIKLIILTLFFLFGIRSASAGEAPILLNPANDSTVSSSSLNWQTPSYPLYSEGSPYRVQVDNDSGFTSIDRDRYKTTNTYSPESLSEGTWFWRVKAKDSTGTWSDWSSVWSFILTSASSPAPTPISSSVPLTTPAVSPSSQPTSSFTISGTPSQINSDQSFSISVNLSLPNNRNTDYYLSGAFKKTDGTRYFGLTKINSSWIKYESSNFLNQYKITTDDSGNWTGTLEVKPDTSDTDYKGTGDYIFKVSRYTANGSQTWSNDSIIKIISTESDEGGNLTNDSSPTISPSSSPSFVKTKTTTSSQPKSYDTLVYHSASVAGAKASASASTSALPEVSVKNQKQVNPIIWVGLVFILIGAGSIGYIYLRKNGKLPF